MIKFSFLIPVYNEEENVIRALNSIPKEYAYEIIVVDDCSKDKTYEKLKEYQKTCPKLKIYRNKKNMGSTFSYNRLLDLAKGDYILILDHDDMYLPPIKDVLNLVDNTYDIYYYNMIRKDGIVYEKNMSNRYTLSANFKVMKRKFVDKTRYSHHGFGDWYFNKALMDKNPKEYYTNLYAYWYDFPKAGSISDLVAKGLMKP